MTHWRPALRMAWRDLRRHKMRAALTMFLVALPVIVAVTASLVHHSTRWEGEQRARVTMGGADALVEITRFPKTRVSYDYGSDMVGKPAEFTTDGSNKRKPVRRERSTVSLDTLLPEGSRLTPAPRPRCSSWTPRTRCHQG